MNFKVEVEFEFEFEFDCIALHCKMPAMGRNVSFKRLAFQLFEFHYAFGLVRAARKPTSACQLSIESQYIEPQCKVSQTNRQ